MTFRPFLLSALSLPLLGNVLAAGDESPLKLDVTTFSDTKLTPSPACLTADPYGDVYVGIDLNGSLKLQPERGRIVKLRDTNGDGVADEHTVFADISHPRGLISSGKDLYVLHSVYDGDKVVHVNLSVLTDADSDGVADGEPKTLVQDISSLYQVNKRGVDHSTNGISMGIDGWIYIAVGDYGFVDATDREGTQLTLWDGGIVRVRPDGTEMEIYATGTRNIYALAPDPYMNIFALDNTNDGGGWRERFTHYIQNGYYGYPRHYQNFTEEMISALSVYDTGSGTGALYLDEPSWPKPFNDNPVVADWRRNQVAVHELTPDGPTFSDKEVVIHKVSQPTGLSIDGSGRLYVSVWSGAGYKGSEDKGMVQQLTPPNWEYHEFPNLSHMSASQLLSGIQSKSNKMRTGAAREIVRRGDQSIARKLLEFSKNHDAGLDQRIAALFTFKQLAGSHASSSLVDLARDDASIREWALRALADRKSQLQGIKVADFTPYLHDDNPRVQVAAINALSRLGDPSAATELLSLAVPPPVRPLVPRPDLRGPKMAGPHEVSYPEVIVPHLAINALVELHALKPSLAAIGGPSTRGALRVLQSLHEPEVVSGLIAAYKKQADEPETQEKILAALARLAAREADFDGTVWWTTRPDTRGPYFMPTAWDQTATILAFFDQVEDKANAGERKKLAHMRKKYRFADVASGKREKPPEAKPTEALVGDTSIEDLVLYVGHHNGNLDKGAEILSQQACASCHAVFPGDSQRAIDLTEIGSKLNQEQLTEAIILPDATMAEEWIELTLDDSTGLQTTLVSRTDEEVVVRDITGKETTYSAEDVKSIKSASSTIMTPHLVDHLSLEDFNNLVDYLASQKGEEGEEQKDS